MSNKPVAVVPPLNLSNLTTEQFAEMFAQYQQIGAALQQHAANQRKGNELAIDSERYRIWLLREEIERLVGRPATDKRPATGLYAEIQESYDKLQVLTGGIGMSKVKISEEEEKTFRARRANEQAAQQKVAAKAGK